MLRCSRSLRVSPKARYYTGFVGAGNMGAGMAHNIAKAGNQVKLFDLNRTLLDQACAQHPNISPAASLAEVAAGADVCVVSVAGEKAEHAVIVDGLMPSCAAGTVLLNCGTNSVGFSRSLHQHAEARGLHFLDAPVSGGPEGAKNGTLAIMCGGEQAAFDAADPVLSAMGGYVVRMGGAGSGAGAKLVNQLLTAANANSACEALALARSLGMNAQEVEGLLQLLGKAWGDSTMLQRTGQILVDAMKTADADAALAANAMAPLRNFRKDLDFVLDAAAEAHLQLPSTAAARMVISKADALGKADADWAYGVSMLAPHCAANEPNVAEPTQIFDNLPDLEASLPAPWPETEEGLKLKAAVLNGRRGLPLAVVDDDPTGTQTVHSVPALGDWTVETLSAALSDDHPCFYVLSNTRALDEPEAVDRARTIGANLRAAANEVSGAHQRLSVVSRGDSTLRGHYPAETDALAAGLGWKEHKVLLAPFFKEGGRLTAHDMHYVLGADGVSLTPAGETEFAKDKAFSFSASHLPTWIEEKTEGNIKKEDVVSISLDLIRRGGPEAVAQKLSSVGAGAAVVVNALTTQDMAVVGLACLKAERAGHLSNVIYRTAGSFVAANSGISSKPLLTEAELSKPASADSEMKATSGGLVVIGSYVGKSSQQLEVLMKSCPWVSHIELDVQLLANGPDSWSNEERSARAQVEAELKKGKSVALYTSRKLVQDDGKGGLGIGQLVTDALCSVVANLDCAPSFVIAKGGITSNDVAVVALGVKNANVMGQVVPGVPVWKCGPETKMPGLPYVVFPGNVGAPDDLARVVSKMAGRTNVTQENIPCMLLDARAQSKAVGAFNVYNLEGAKAVCAAAEAMGAPAILQLHPSSLQYGGRPLLHLCQELARDSAVPIAVQLDHSQCGDSLHMAIGEGIDGIMADGSHLPFDENITWTAKYAALAAARGIATEAELGKLAGEEDGLSVPEVEARMTDPAVVADFIERTGVNSLAVTIGNVHGVYAKPPALDFVRLDKIRVEAGTSVPLVLHGASGLPDEMIRQAMDAGVCKFNVNTEVRHAALASLSKNVNAGADYLACMEGATADMIPVIQEKMKLFGW